MISNFYLVQTCGFSAAQTKPCVWSMAYIQEAERDAVVTRRQAGESKEGLNWAAKWRAS